MKIVEHPSPNYGSRKGRAVDMVVLHYTVLGLEESLARLCDPQAEVSAHYVIAESGTIFRLVPDCERAWHAGRAFWGGERDVNARSLGIELVNDAKTDFPKAQLGALVLLLRQIRSEYSVPVTNVVGHSDVAPGRKSDPGARFPWSWLAAQGQAVFLEAQSEAPWPGDGAAKLRSAMVRAGYDPDVDTDVLLEALRLRFLPQALGDAPGAREIALAEALAKSGSGVDASKPLV